MPKNQSFPWEDIREDWINHEKIGVIMKRYNVGQNTVYNYARKHGWEKRSIEEMKTEQIFTERLLQDKYRKRAREEILEATSQIEQTRLLHRVHARATLKELEQLRIELEGKRLKDELSVSERIDGLKRISEASKTMIEMERKLYGMNEVTEVTETDILMQSTDDPVVITEAYAKFIG